MVGSRLLPKKKKMIRTKSLELKGKKKKKRFICMIDAVMKSKIKYLAQKQKKNSKDQN